MTSAKIDNMEKIKNFVLAGNAKFTIVSKKTGTRFTYNVKKAKNSSVFFVAVLTGPDNEKSYSYIGYVKPTWGFAFNYGHKSKFEEKDTQVQAFNWFWTKVITETVTDQVEFWHEGKCGRCGRALTVPESIETGLGPICRER